MKYRIEAERRQFLSLVVEAETQAQAEEAARMASLECWDHDPEEDDQRLTEVGEANVDEEAFWRVTPDGDLEPYDEVTAVRAAEVAGRASSGGRAAWEGLVGPCLEVEEGAGK